MPEQNVRELRRSRAEAGQAAAGRLRDLRTVHGSGPGFVPEPPPRRSPEPERGQIQRPRPDADLDTARGSAGVPVVPFGAPGDAQDPRAGHLDARRLGLSARAVGAVVVLVLALAAGVFLRVVLSGAGDELPVSAQVGGSSRRTSAAQEDGMPGAGVSGRATRSATADGGAGLLLATAPGASPAVVVVDVVGHVRRPGIVRLPVGARVADVVAAAGGADAGAALARLNLARRVVDGEQVVVPGPHDPLPAGAADGSGDGTAGPGNQGGAGVPLDLNAATAAQLDALPGVGAVTAQRILAWRTQHQRFSRVDELGEVPGIGPKMLERLRPLVRV